VHLAAEHQPAPDELGQMDVEEVVLRPDRIIVGGGVMRPPLYGLVREALVRKLAGYDASLRDLDPTDYIARPTAGASAGFTGALALAYRLVAGRWPMHWAVGALESSKTESLIS